MPPPKKIIRQIVGQSKLDFVRQTHGGPDTKGTATDSWLTDTEINEVQRLIKRDFPHIQGLQPPSCLLVGNTSEYCVHDQSQTDEAAATITGLQIHLVNGNHWILSTYCNGHIQLIDSLNTSDTSYALEIKQQLRLAYPCCSESKTASYEVKQPQKQSDNSSCGLFAIATAVELAFGRDPYRITFDDSLLRGHLAQCLQKASMEPFPKMPFVTPTPESFPLPTKNPDTPDGFSSLPNPDTEMHPVKPSEDCGMKHLASPYQPNASSIPPQQVKNRKFFFQNHWYKTYPWIHYEQIRKAVLCFSCAKASAFGLLGSVKCSESSFLSLGYTNWKKAVGKNSRFEAHQSSNCHVVATRALHDLLESTPVANLLSQQLSSDQTVACKCLSAIFTSVRYLARQGLALRGHTETEGNFMQLLRLRTSDLPDLTSWLTRRSDYTHHSIQNEILQLYGNAILREITASARESQSFAVIVDGTQDVNRVEQESICIRFVTKDLEPREEFVGFYAVEDTTGKALASCVKDALLRFQLPLEKLRGQTYDGASNMSGVYNGCQAIIAQTQPLATYVHCAAHCSNLVASAACASSEIVCSSIQLINDFGVLCSASGKFKSLFANIASSVDGTPVRNIKPLCPTRWLVRLPAIQATLQQYGAILASLQETSDCSTEVKVRASGLHCKFQDGATLMCLAMAKRVIEPLECLNRALQSKSATIASMLEAAKQCREQLECLRTEEELQKIMRGVEETIEKLELDPLRIPRRRQPPKRLCGPATAYHPTTVVQYYTVEFYKVLDVSIQQLSSRLLESPGIQRYKELQMVLVDGIITDVVHAYPELSSSTLQAELDLFRRLPSDENSVTSLSACVDTLRNMAPAMRSMFPTVESLVRLLLVNPASSASAERSFSGLRRLKSYLRSTCGQLRLNNIALCHVHKDILDKLENEKLMREFILKMDSRCLVFGKV